MSTLKVNNLQDLGADAVVTNGVIEKAALPAGSILQVVSTTKTDTYSASIAVGDESAITGLSASITPSSTASKIFVIVSVSIGTTPQSESAQIILYRGATAISIGDAAGNRTPRTSGSGTQYTRANASVVANFLDSPSTTSSTTYSVNVAHTNSITDTVYVNRSNLDSDEARFGRTVSSITLMEVAG